MFQLIDNAVLPKSSKQDRISRKEALSKGNKFYFTGNACPKGHICERFTSTCNCRICQREIQMANQHEYRLKEHYKISLNEYNAMLIAQNNTCAICKQPETTIDGQTKEIKKLSVDHCHDTGKVRGLLCNNCNQGIGKFKHNSDFLRKAALYCEENK